MVNNVIDCKFFFQNALNVIKNNCSGVITGTTCTPNCRQILQKSLGVIDRCGSLFRNDTNSTGTLPTFDEQVRNVLRRARYLCNVTSRKVDVTVSDDETTVDVTSEDSLKTDRPRTHLRFICKRALQWMSERFDKFNDANPAKRMRFKLRKIHEFRARINAEADADFTTSGFDPAKDTATQSFDLEDETAVEYENVTDLGNVDVYAPTDSSEPRTNGTQYENAGFRRAFRCAVRFGTNRISRVILSSIATNIRNGIKDGQITVPGGVSFNLVIDNFPYKANDTSVSFEFDVDNDKDEGNLVENVAGETDSEGGLNLADNTEGRLEFGVNDTRRIRWRRQVYCDGNKLVIIRVRFVKTSESVDGGFVVRKKLFVTFHIDRSSRCSKLLWDPTNDIETPEEPFVAGPTGGTESTSGTATSGSATSGSTTTGAGTQSGKTSSNVTKLFASFLFVLYALFIY